MNCITCGHYTKNPKFCSRKCAATTNNTLYPKRLAEHLCKNCSEPINSLRRYCSSECRTIARKDQIADFANLTLEQVREQGTANFRSRYPYIRTHSRKTFIKSGKPLKCLICEYALHVDICHIKDVSKFPLNTKISEINSIENLVALCKNHHWEFDHGYLQGLKMQA